MNAKRCNKKNYTVPKSTHGLFYLIRQTSEFKDKELD